MAEKESEVSECAVGALSTNHLYYANTEVFSNVAKVIGEHTVEINGGQLTAVVLDETVMHPQGGMFSHQQCIRLVPPHCGDMAQYHPYTNVV